MLAQQQVRRKPAMGGVADHDRYDMALVCLDRQPGLGKAPLDGRDPLLMCCPLGLALAQMAHGRTGAGGQ